MEQVKPISLAFKSFLRSRALLILYSVSAFIALFLLGLMLFPEALLGQTVGHQEIFIFHAPFVIRILLVTLFIVAFEFSRKIHKKERDTLFHVGNFAPQEIVGSALVVLLALWAIVLTLALAILSISAVIADPFSAEIVNIVSVAILRLGGATLIATLLGLFLGRVEDRLAAYSLLAVIVFLSSFIGAQLVDGALGFDSSYTLRLIIHWVFLAPFELLTITSMTAQFDSIYLFPNEPHQWLLPGIWIVSILLGIAASLRWKKDSSFFVFMLAFGLMVTPWAVYGSQIALPRYSAAPHSINERSLMPEVFSSDRVYNPLVWDYEYSIPAVANYAIDLEIRSKLSGKVTISLDEPFLRTPDFTLFRGYRLSSVSTSEGKQLDFLQEGDHITILTPGQEETMGFIFEYAGSGWGHYANQQGIFLPGSFPWYPWPGKQRYYWEDSRFNAWMPVHFSRIGDVRGFDIRVTSSHSEILVPHGSQEIILAQSDEFISIPAEALTLIAGQVQRIGDEDNLIFYSGIRGLRFFEDLELEYLPNVSDRAVRQQIRERAYEIREMMGLENSHELNSTSFVMVPEFPTRSNLYRAPIYLDGYILVDEHMQVDFALALAMQDIVRTCEKRDVYETLFSYLIQDNSVHQHMPMIDMMADLIRAEGEERAIQLIVEYLMDDSMTMSGREFFQSLSD
ncbi:MAG: hypothetical protein FWC86_02155 [Coriobacteriia bacterium]|nr:hypothetical protein [Coriobacteriia bacterium]